MVWAAALRLTDAMVAQVFDGELFTVIPMARSGNVNVPAQLDDTRQPFSFEGSIDQFPRDSQVSFAQPPNVALPDSRSAAVSHEWVITADAYGWPYWPAPDDFIDHGSTRYTIGGRPRDDSGRAVIFVNRVRKP